MASRIYSAAPGIAAAAAAAAAAARLCDQGQSWDEPTAPPSASVLSATLPGNREGLLGADKGGWRALGGSEGGAVAAAAAAAVVDRDRLPGLPPHLLPQAPLPPSRLQHTTLAQQGGHPGWHSHSLPHLREYVESVGAGFGAASAASGGSGSGRFTDAPLPAHSIAHIRLPSAAAGVYAGGVAAAAPSPATTTVGQLETWLEQDEAPDAPHPMPKGPRGSHGEEPEGAQGQGQGQGLGLPPLPPASRGPSATTLLTPASARAGVGPSTGAGIGSSNLGTIASCQAQGSGQGSGKGFGQGQESNLSAGGPALPTLAGSGGNGLETMSNCMGATGYHPDSIVPGSYIEVLALRTGSFRQGKAGDCKHGLRSCWGWGVGRGMAGAQGGGSVLRANASLASPFCLHPPLVSRLCPS